jgi:hypothetical protein
MADDYYGAPSSVDSSKTLGQRLREFYDPEDFVTVQNVDTEEITYQFANPTDIETFSDYPGHKDTIQKATPQRITLQPGETKLCPAYEADLMIENLIKQITMRSAEKEAKDENVRYKSSNWTDPTTQDRFIREIFVGKKDVVGSYNKELKSEVAKDLENAKSSSSK